MQTARPVMDEQRDLERLAVRVADQVCGGRPRQCTGWNAKIWNAAHDAVLATADEFAGQPRRTAPTEGAIEQARYFALEVLLRRLPQAPVEKREVLRGRIAAIRSGRLDTCPEVEAALDAILARSPLPA